MNIQLKENLAKIVKNLQNQGMKTTKLAHIIGFTTTTQLYNTIEGKSLLSTKAVQHLIENFNVNPFYLFLGKGDMFIPDETEIETLRRKNEEWEEKYNKIGEIVTAHIETIEILKRRNADLIDISTSAIKYYKELKNK